MINNVPGFKIGHYTDKDAMTGCTVILCPPNTRGSCEVRGNSPGSRELALLAPEKSMQEVNAVLLTGGSAYGLAAATGVVKWLEERGIGYKTPWGVVPIVPTAVVFDLNVGRSDVRPDERAGYLACENASDAESGAGNIGAGAGATVGKWAGLESKMRGGVGYAIENIGDLIVSVLAVVNAVGDVVDAQGKIIVGARSADGKFIAETNSVREFARGKKILNTNTTLVVMASNASLTKLELFKICQRMHDGMARAVVPVHTSYDGDVTFALSNGNVQVDIDFIAEVSAKLTAEAIRKAVTY